MLTIHRGLAGLEELQHEWQLLVGEDPRYWMQYGYVEEAVRHSIGGPDNVVLYTLRDLNGGALAIVPVRPVVVPIRRVKFDCFELLGSTFDDVTCQASGVDFPAVDLGSATLALRATVEALKVQKPRPSLLVVGRVTQDARALAATLSAHKRQNAHVSMSGYRWVSVDRRFEALQSDLSGKFKISLKSCRRRLDELGKVEIGTTTRDEPKFKEVLEEFLAVEASGWKGDTGTRTGLLVNPVGNQRYFLESLCARKDIPAMEVNWIRLNGRMIAGQLWMRASQSRVAFKIGYVEDFSRYQPGHLLMEHVLRDSCHDQSLKVVDFVSDAGWLDKWRAKYSPHFTHYLPVSGVAGVLSSFLLRFPSWGAIRPHLSQLKSMSQH